MDISERYQGSRGQAMIELTVGMLVLIVLIAVIFQLTIFVRAGHETAVNARALAGGRALLDYPYSATADYIGETGVGEDGKPYTRDDRDAFLPADSNRYKDNILEPLAGEPTDWNTLETIPGNAFSELRASASPISIFGLLRGEDSVVLDDDEDNEQTETLLPAIQHLLYNADHIRIEETVWMPWTKGVY